MHHELDHEDYLRIALKWQVMLPSGLEPDKFQVAQSGQLKKQQVQVVMLQFNLTIHPMLYI
jgi:hypothetical protein